ncbi:MAG: phosphate acyltransferase PlsX [Oscillospiraceae bacterium]|nr:phosphate acyltransferase PlsX [Oscillospiraceae bacterium]
MKIIIDAMSGDNAPNAQVEGAILARKELGVDVVLTGHPAVLERCLRERGAAQDSGITVVPAMEIIDMHDDPSTAVRRKKDSSMAVALNLLRDGEGDAVVSAGNTGALLTGATLLVKRIRGVRRACMAPVLPNGGSGALLIDCGANVDCTSEYLMQFAYMGSFYAQRMLGVDSPRVGLLNNGAEDTKGGALQREVYALLRQAGEAGRINFVGNIEGSDIFSGKAEVIVTDGFSGNVVLKTIEGTAKFLMKNLKGALTSSPKAKLGALLVKDSLSGLKKMLDVSEVGGTPFLGIQKPVIKAHGSSDARAIRSAARQAADFAASGFIADVERNAEYMRLRTEETGNNNGNNKED